MNRRSSAWQGWSRWQPLWQGLARRTWLLNLALWAAYTLLGRAGLLLALPPGYASPLFAPAGLALAACTAGGRRMLPGIALGSLSVNLVYPWLNTGTIGAAALLGALASALGAALQAAAGSALFRRYIDASIGSGRDVVRFLLLAPAIALISSSASLGGMAMVGVLPWRELPLEWLAWWMGDTSGILLAAPLLWIVIGQPRALWWRRRTLLGVPLLLSTAAFVLIYLQADRWEVSQQLQTFRLKAQQTGDVLQAQFSEHERFIYAMSKALNDAGGRLTAEDFGNLARGYLDQRPELLSLAWLKPVSDAERPAFEQWGRLTIAPGFEIREAAPGAATPVTALRRAGRRAQYFVSTFVEPARSPTYQSFDYLSDAPRRATLQYALQSGQPTASPPLRLLRDSRASGIVLLQATYGAREHARDVTGALLIALSIDAYLDQALKQIDFPDFLVRLEDSDASGATAVLRDGLRRPAAGGDFHRQLHFGGRIYQLTLAPTPLYVLQHHGWQSWTVFSGGLLLTALLGALMMLISGERARIQGQVKDSTARLREREARLQAILDKAADAILTIATDGTLLSANAAAGRLFGLAPEAMTGLPLSRLLPRAAHDGAAALLRGIAAGASHEHHLDGRRGGADGGQDRHQDGDGGGNDDGGGDDDGGDDDGGDDGGGGDGGGDGDGGARPGRFPLAISVSEVDLPDEHLFVAILHDLTEQQRAQERIHKLAHHDPLTGLDNRLSLNLRLDLLLAQTRRNGGAAAVLFIDLDHFKKINDSHGHQTGDLLLQAVAGRLQELLREVDTIARLGGDEFIVVTSGTITPDEAGGIAVRIVDALGAPYHLPGQTVHSGASVGVAMFPGDGDDGSTLLRHADTAMYAAKSQGRGNFQFFSGAMNAATHERLLLENRLWLALEQHEFELYLQPQIRLSDLSVIGAEALLRWHHPELGMVAPDRFIPIAEESGLILPLGDWVLQRAFSLLVGWREQGLGHLRLAVNLSARQCHGAGLLPLLDRLLAATGVDAALLELEITESAAMQDPKRSRVLLRELRTRGIKVAIDDFGTGYSSLSYLKLFELDRIKIDRGFVKDIETDPNDAVIVAATIALAHSLGLGVVAEGVETQAQCDFLRAKHCEEAQGYLFARPMPAHAFEAMLRVEAG